MKKLAIVLQIFLGLPLVVFGFDYFFGFLPKPEHNERALAFHGEHFQDLACDRRAD